MEKTDPDKIHRLTQGITPANCRAKFQALIPQIINAEWPHGRICPVVEDLKQPCLIQPLLIRKLPQTLPAFKGLLEKFLALAILAELHYRLKQQRKFEAYALQAVKLMAETEGPVAHGYQEQDANDRKNLDTKNLMSNTFFELFRCHRFQSRKMLIQILKIIRRIRDSNFKLHCFSELTRFYEDREGKDPTIMREMEKFPDSIPDLRDQGYAGLRVASIYIKAKNYRRAWKLLNPDVFYIHNLKSSQVRLCDLYARMGKFAQALELAAQNEEALSNITVEYAKVGSFKKALALARNIQDQRERDYALRDIAFEYVARHQFRNALKISPRIKDGWGNAMLLREIAIAHAEKHRFNQALNMIERMEFQPLGPEPAITIVARNMARSRSTNKGMIHKIVALGKRILPEEEKEEFYRALRVHT